MTIEQECARIDAAVEARDQMLHDQAYCPQEVECHWCERRFMDDGENEIYGTDFEPDLIFCCKTCVDDWKAEYGWEYTEEDE